MLEWLSVVLLIVVALILIVAELIFVPGTTLVGLIGLACMALGIYLSFDYFGSGTGWLVLGISGIGTFIIVIYGFHSRAWERFALKKRSKSRVNEDFKMDLKIGQVGKALSTLRPVGKAEFGSQVIEVQSLGNYVKTGAQIRIINLKDNKIIVEPYSG
jgi:membrane-bound ClpP family serine protease